MSDALAVAPPPVPIPYGDTATWTTPMDVAELTWRVEWCRAEAPTHKEKGDRLEQLLCWLLPHLPGVRVEAKDLFSADRSQEIDILAWNSQEREGLPFVGTKLVAECKNWRYPVDSSDVAWLAWKMRLGGVADGILLAANGITSNSKRRDAAVNILTASNSDEPSRKIYVLTLDEVAALSSARDLRELIKMKSIRLSARDPFP